jgi:hypothetical protein
MSVIDLFNFEPDGYVEEPGTIDNTPPIDTNLDASVKIHDACAKLCAAKTEHEYQKCMELYNAAAQGTK